MLQFKLVVGHNLLCRLLKLNWRDGHRHPAVVRCQIGKLVVALGGARDSIFKLGGAVESSSLLLFKLFSLILVKPGFHKANFFLVKCVFQRLIVSHLHHFAESVDLGVDLDFICRSRRFGISFDRFLMFLECLGGLQRQLLLQPVHNVVMSQ